MLKESLNRLCTYSHEGAMVRYVKSWIDQLRWQRLEPFEKLAPENRAVQAVHAGAAQSAQPLDVGAVHASAGSLSTSAQGPTPLSFGAVLRQASEIRAVCARSACTDLWGGAGP
jgi:hypothetical protein